MKKLIIITLMALVPVSAFAITPGEVIGGIFQFILNHIDKNPNGTVNTGKKVILKTNGNNIILARLYLTKQAGDTDAVNLPACNNANNNSLNKRIDYLRLRVAEAGVHINKVRVSFGNGTAKTFAVDDDFGKGSQSSWVNLGNNRCVRSIQIQGHANGGNNKTISAVTFVGRLHDNNF